MSTRTPPGWCSRRRADRDAGPRRHPQGAGHRRAPGPDQGDRHAGGQACAGLLDFFNRYDKERYHIPGAPLHDPCVIAYLLRPELFRANGAGSRSRPRAPTPAGRTVVDWWRRGRTRPTRWWSTRSMPRLLRAAERAAGPALSDAGGTARRARPGRASRGEGGGAAPPRAQVRPCRRLTGDRHAALRGGARAGAGMPLGDWPDAAGRGAGGSPPRAGGRWSNVATRAEARPNGAGAAARGAEAARPRERADAPGRRAARPRDADDRGGEEARSERGQRLRRNARSGRRPSRARGPQRSGWQSSWRPRRTRPWRGGRELAPGPRKRGPAAERLRTGGGRAGARAGRGGPAQRARNWPRATIWDSAAKTCASQYGGARRTRRWEPRPSCGRGGPVPRPPPPPSRAARSRAYRSAFFARLGRRWGPERRARSRASGSSSRPTWRSRAGPADARGARGRAVETALAAAGAAIPARSTG